MASVATQNSVAFYYNLVSQVEWGSTDWGDVGIAGVSRFMATIRD
jgi:hypothetical protein